MDCFDLKPDFHCFQRTGKAGNSCFLRKMSEEAAAQGGRPQGILNFKDLAEYLRFKGKGRNIKIQRRSATYFRLRENLILGR